MTAAPVRQSQITRAVKAVRAAGEPIGRIEIAPDGTVNIYTCLGFINTEDAALEEWMSKNAREN